MFCMVVDKSLEIINCKEHRETAYFTASYLLCEVRSWTSTLKGNPPSNRQMWANYTTIQWSQRLCLKLWFKVQTVYLAGMGVTVGYSLASVWSALIRNALHGMVVREKNKPCLWGLFFSVSTTPTDHCNCTSYCSKGEAVQLCSWWVKMILLHDFLWYRD